MWTTSLSPWPGLIALRRMRQNPKSSLIVPIANPCLLQSHRKMLWPVCKDQFEWVSTFY